MPPEDVTGGSSVSARPRIKIFVDYWNLQLTINEKVSFASGLPNSRFPIDWLKLPMWVAKEAAAVAGVDNFSYEGTIVYCSSDNSPEGVKFRNWAENWLHRQSGIQVQCRARKPRSRMHCPTCNDYVIPICPLCSNPIRGKTEKGVDTAIATDMIRLAWEGAYDIAVLVSLDADLVPAVEFLDAKGRKVILAGFPPKGRDLMKACWGSFDLFSGRDDFEREGYVVP